MRSWKVTTLMAALVFLIGAIPLTQSPQLPYDVAVSFQDIVGHQVVRVRGQASNSTAVLQTAWENNTIYVFPPAATTMTVSSTDPDDNAAGTGARAVQVTCLDANYEPFTETVALAGQTGVPMVNQCFRVQGNGVLVPSAGATGANEGTIYVGTGAVAGGVPATRYGIVAPGDNVSAVGVYTIPAYKKATIQSAIVSASADKFITGRISGRPPGALFYRVLTVNFFQQLFSLNLFYSIPIPERTDLRVDFRSDKSGAVVNMAINILMINQPRP